MSLTYQRSIKYRVKFVFITEDFEEIVVYPFSYRSDCGYYDYLEESKDYWWPQDSVLISELEKGEHLITLTSNDYLFGGEGILDVPALAVKVFYEKVEQIVSQYEFNGEKRGRHLYDVILETVHYKTIKRRK